jgi:hypothetical protein
VHADKTKDIAIDRVVTEQDRAPDAYAHKIRNLLGAFILSDTEVHKRFARIAVAQGAVIVALPSEADLRAQALSLFYEALRLSKVEHSKVRGVYFHVHESETRLGIFA